MEEEKAESDLFHELNDGVGEQIRTSVTELLESHEARIWVPENTMTISENETPRGNFQQIRTMEEKIRK